MPKLAVSQRFSTPSDRVASSLLVMRMRDRPDRKSRDSCEVAGITCVERQRIRDRARRDERVIRSRRRLAPRCAQCRRHGAKCPRAVTIKRKNIKVGLGLLQVLLTG